MRKSKVNIIEIAPENRIKIWIIQMQSLYEFLISNPNTRQKQPLLYKRIELLDIVEIFIK